MCKNKTSRNNKSKGKNFVYKVWEENVMCLLKKSMQKI